MSTADRQKWDAKYADPSNAPREPSAVLVGLAQYLPVSGSALEVAGGGGRNALWLARRGLDVTITDISRVGLQIAQMRATEAGVKIRTLEIDLEQDRLKAGPFDLIVSVCYLHRPLFAEFPRLLAPEGVLTVIQPTKRNLERNDKPPAAFLLDEGELRKLISGLEMVHYEEDWLSDGRHDAVLVARKQT